MHHLLQCQFVCCERIPGHNHSIPKIPSPRYPKFESDYKACANDFPEKQPKWFSLALTVPIQGTEAARPGTPLAIAKPWMKPEARLLDPLRYTCYRKFLCDYMAAERLSYRAFALKHSAYVSFPFLSKLLRRNPAGQFVREVNTRPEKLAALLKAMGLDPKQISHLILCRLNTDQVQGQYRHSATFSQVLNSFIAPEGGMGGISEKWLEALQALSATRREKVIEELRHQLEIEMARSPSAVRAQRLRGLLEKV